MRMVLLPLLNRHIVVGTENRNRSFIISWHQTGIIKNQRGSVRTPPFGCADKLSPNIYVPVKRRATLKPETVQEIAQSMLEVGQTTPILVRRDSERFVLVHGLHRLEACKALGEESIFGYLVQAQRH